MPSASETTPNCAQDQLHASMILAQSVLVTGGTFNINHTRTQEPAIHHGRAIRKFFKDHIMLDATYETNNNDHHFLESLPNEHTSELMTKLLDWSQKPTLAKSIAYVRGNSGTEQTSFAKSLARKLDDKGILGASFFFRLGDQDQEQKFVATLALQLMTAVPSLQPSVMAAVNADPFIFQKLSQKQANKLIIDPIMSNTFDFPTQIAVIDGLDRCRSQDAQCRMSSLVVYIASQVESKLKFIILGGHGFEPHDTAYIFDQWGFRTDGLPLDRKSSVVAGHGDVPAIPRESGHIHDLRGKPSGGFLGQVKNLIVLLGYDHGCVDFILFKQIFFFFV